MSKVIPREYSVVIPVYNEEGSLRALFDEVLKVLESLQQSFEIIFVNDASCDDSLTLIQQFAQEHPQRVVVIDEPKRCGQTHAMRQGLRASRGRIVMTMDADLQNDPHDIPKLLKKMEEGFDCVCGWRKSRQDTLLKSMLSKTGNVLQRLFVSLNVHDVSCTLRAYQRHCVSKVPLNWEGQHRFIPLSLALQGFTVGEVESNHRLRRYGKSKYTHKRIFRVVVDFFKIIKSRGQA